MSNKKELPKKGKEKRLFLIAGFSFSFLIFFLFLAFLINEILFFKKLNSVKAPAIKKEIKAEKCDDCVRRYLDGVYVRAGKENLPPAAVIIENLVEARPQYGLSKANLVYEAEAEGRITRFLAVFDSSVNIEKIGPVRSARPYFIDWASELSALFVHCGGSPQALAKIAAENTFDLNEFYQGDFFWRGKTKPAPHNIFTSSDNLQRYLELKNVKEGKFLPWQFKDDVSLADRPEAGEIEVDFPLSDYVVKWKYNKGTNDYTRYTGGLIHKDDSGNEIKAKNVIIEYAKAKIIDEELRLIMEHIGRGKAIICLDGKCEEGGWRKDSLTARARFYKNSPSDKMREAGLMGEEFKFNAGPTWIEVVRPEYEVIIK